MRQKIFSMLPPGYRYFKQESIIRLPKPWGSEIHLKSADAGREKFQGAGLLAAWFDEEPKGIPGEEIFGEVYARRSPGVPLNIYMTFTPLHGISWAWRRLWNKESKERFPGVETFRFELYDCSISHGGYLSDEEIKTIEAGYSQWEREARVHGKFIFSGSPYFSPKAIQETRQKCERGKSCSISMQVSSYSPKVREDDAGKLLVFRPPVPGRSYIIGVDCAAGIGRDASTCVVFDREDKAVVAEYHDNEIDPDVFGADRVLPLGLHYNSALLVVETNGEYGGAVLSTIKGRYGNLFVRQEWDKVAMEYRNEYGFRTTLKTRGRIFATLSKYLREQEWTPSASLLDEMAMMTVEPDGKVDHPDGAHDDRVIAAGIALTVMEENPHIKDRHWSKCRVNVSGPKELAWMGY